MDKVDKITSKMKEVTDFRKHKGRRYKLHNILTISILSLLSGADDFDGMAVFAKSKKDFLLEQGLLDGYNFPSHDLFRWIFMRMDGNAFAMLLGTWLEHSLEKASISSADPPPLKRIHIDGKSLRATRTNEHSRTALQVVSAYVSNSSLCMGQLLIDGKSCEKTAIPQLIDLLDLKNSVTTIDAVGTMKSVATKIIDRQGHYLLALKKNNRLFYQEVADFFRVFADTPLVSLPFATEEKAHGRIEKRSCQVITDLQYFADAGLWKNLRTLVRVESEQVRSGKVLQETRYYLSSLSADEQMLSDLIRKHWTVENNLHWSLDVSFYEDNSRVRDKNAANALSGLRRFGLALLKNAKISKNSIKGQRLQAAWDNQFLLNLFEILK